MNLGPQSLWKNIGRIAVIGFTLLVWFLVVLPTYGKYRKCCGTSEAASNEGAISMYEEAYFSEHGAYVSAGPNPRAWPSTQKGGRAPFDSSMEGWAELGKVMGVNTPVAFQYEVRAGMDDANGNPIIDPIRRLVSPTEIVRPGRENCRNADSIFNTSARSLGISPESGKSWYYATGVGDPNENGICELYIKVIDRPDLIVVEDPTERGYRRYLEKVKRFFWRG